MTSSSKTDSHVFHLSVFQPGGGCLSIKKHDSGKYDIFFSYSDRIDEISAADFCNIVPNFIETAARLRFKFILGEHSESPVPSIDASSPSKENASVGLAAKFL